MLLSELIEEGRRLLALYGDRPVKGYPASCDIAGIFLSDDDLQEEKETGHQAPVLVEVQDV